MSIEKFTEVIRSQVSTIFPFRPTQWAFSFNSSVLDLLGPGLAPFTQSLMSTSELISAEIFTAEPVVP